MSGLQGAILCRGNPSGFLTSFLDPDFEVFEGCAPAVGEEPSVLEAGTRLWGSWSVLISPLPSSHLRWRLLDSSGEFGTRCCAEFYKAMLIHHKAVPRVTQPGAKSCSSGCVSLDFCLRRWSMGEPREAGPWPSSPRKLWCCYSMGAWKKRLSSSKEQMTACACSVSSGFLSAAALRCDEALPFLLPPHPPPLLMTPFPVCAINLKAPYYSVLSFYKLHIFLVSLLYES